MKKLIAWDFDKTLAERKNGMWAQTLSEIALDKAGVKISQEKFIPFLQEGFFWHNWEKPHTHIRTADDWWEKMHPVFENGLKKNGVESVLAEFVREYYTNPVKWSLIDSAVEVLKHFEANNFYQVVLSNHVPELEKLIISLGIRRFFEKIYNSAFTGYEKPHHQSFAMIKNDFPEVEEFWMVGDSVTVDMKGAKTAGFKTFWFNPDRKKCDEEEAVDYEIKSLKEFEMMMRGSENA